MHPFQHSMIWSSSFTGSTILPLFARLVLNHLWLLVCRHSTLACETTRRSVCVSRFCGKSCRRSSRRLIMRRNIGVIAAHRRQRPRALTIGFTAIGGDMLLGSEMQKAKCVRVKYCDYIYTWKRWNALFNSSISAPVTMAKKKKKSSHSCFWVRTVYY